MSQSEIPCKAVKYAYISSASSAFLVSADLALNISIAISVVVETSVLEIVRYIKTTEAIESNDLNINYYFVDT